jgi:ankyrin repeat protein
LSWAAENGHDAIVKQLLDTSKVDTDSKDNDRRAPLLYAAMNGNEAIVKLLLDTGKVNVESRDEYGRSLLSCAA